MTDAYKFIGTGVMILKSETVIGNLNDVVSNLHMDRCKVRHASKRRGYIPVKSVLVCEYNGRFGRGYTLHCPSSMLESANYHTVIYMIEEV